MLSFSFSLLFAAVAVLPLQLLRASEAQQHTYTHSHSHSHINKHRQHSPLVLERVAESPAFITQDQWLAAYNASLPYLAVPLNNSSRPFDFIPKTSYPSFINYAITIGNITTLDELAQYYAQLLYQSNGFLLTKDPACYDQGSENCQALGLSAESYGLKVNYYGRGYLWLQGESMYRAVSSDLFGQDVSLLVHPDAITHNPSLNFATSAWLWKTLVAPGRTNFGSTTAALRPTTCNGSPTQPTPSSVAAWNVYVAVLKVLSPEAVPSSGFC